MVRTTASINRVKLGALKITWPNHDDRRTKNPFARGTFSLFSFKKLIRATKNAKVLMNRRRGYLAPSPTMEYYHLAAARRPSFWGTVPLRQAGRMTVAVTNCIRPATYHGQTPAAPSTRPASTILLSGIAAVARILTKEIRRVRTPGTLTENALTW